MTTDYYGHGAASSNGKNNALTSGAAGATNPGTIAPTDNAGASASVTDVNANDTAGRFTLNVSGTPAAGAQAVVTFAVPFATEPRHVTVQVADAADTAPIASAYASLTSAGFSVATGALTDGHAYSVSYAVLL